MSAFLKDLIQRLFRTETLATIAALVAVLTGHVQTLQEAIALLGSVGALVGGRSYVKAKQAQGVLQQAQADVPVVAPVAGDALSAGHSLVALLKELQALFAPPPQPPVVAPHEDPAQPAEPLVPGGGLTGG